VFQIDRKQRGGQGDHAFLERVFHKLMLNFTWWVNRKDEEGNNVFEGGFLGLDNIGPIDRSAPLPVAGTLEQVTQTFHEHSLCLFGCPNICTIDCGGSRCPAPTGPGAGASGPAVPLQ
jgi:hypothetical protein